MLLSAYIDESGTHGANTMIMSAHIGDMYQWYWFEDKAAKLLADNGVEVFHAQEFHDGDGPFKGWKIDRKVSFLDDLGTIANQTLGGGCNVVLRPQEYEQYYIGDERPRKVRLDSAYGVCFRSALQFLAQGAAQLEVKQWGPPHERFLNVVVEQGHKNQGDVARIYEDFKANLLPQYVGLLSSIEFKTKVECLALAISDLMAHSTFRFEEGHKPRWRAKSKLKMVETYKKDHFRIEINRETLAAAKADIMRRDAELIARARAAK